MQLSVRSDMEQNHQPWGIADCEDTEEGGRELEEEGEEEEEGGEEERMREDSLEQKRVLLVTLPLLSLHGEYGTVVGPS